MGDRPLERKGSKTFIWESNRQIDAIGIYGFGVLSFLMMTEDAGDVLLHSKLGFSLSVFLLLHVQLHVLFNGFMFVLSRLVAGPSR